MSAEDEARALAHRQSRARRADFQRALDARMAGTPAARAQLGAEWAPLRRWLDGKDDAEPLPEDSPLRGN